MSATSLRLADCLCLTLEYRFFVDSDDSRFGIHTPGVLRCHRNDAATYYAPLPPKSGVASDRSRSPSRGVVALFTLELGPDGLAGVLLIHAWMVYES